jgi:urea carboxylase-associated protein 2
LTPDDYRRRYEELKAQGQKANARRAPPDSVRNPQTIAASDIILEETIPGGWYWTGKIARGHTLRLINEGAGGGIAALFWNANDPSERFNPADSIKVQWTARLSRGRLLFSDMGRVLCSITEDTCGFHDFVAGASSRWSDDAKFGPDPDRRNSRDNFLLAAAKHGLSSRDVGPCVSFFAPIVTDEAGKLSWRAGAVKAGDYLDLRAEMDLIFALSNCPHPLHPAKAWSAPPARAILWRSPSAGPRDLCRTATEEAVRAFENTDALARH